ncbi:MAG: DUF6273 domain-containing protein [Lachnospiraceae bacterium]|nr:DUF6273 domain-containing protein [Lachnospiraceae bacterium]
MKKNRLKKILAVTLSAACVASSALSPTQITGITTVYEASAAETSAEESSEGENTADKASGPENPAAESQEAEASATEPSASESPASETRAAETTGAAETSDAAETTGAAAQSGETNGIEEERAAAEENEPDESEETMNSKTASSTESGKDASAQASEQYEDKNAESPEVAESNGEPGATDEGTPEEEAFEENSEENSEEKVSEETAETIAEEEQEEKVLLDLSEMEEEAGVNSDDGIRHVRITGAGAAASDVGLRLYFWNYQPTEEFPADMEEWKDYLTEPLQGIWPDGLDVDTLSMELPVTMSDGRDSSVRALYQEENGADNTKKSVFLSLTLPQGATIDTDIDLARVDGSEEIHLFLEAVIVPEGGAETVLDGLSLCWETREQETAVLNHDSGSPETEWQTDSEAEREAESEATEKVVTVEEESETESEPETEGETEETEPETEDETETEAQDAFAMSNYTLSLSGTDAASETDRTAGLQASAKTPAGDDSADDSPMTASVEEEGLAASAEEGSLMASSNTSVLWWFDDYYVNESDSAHVKETDDFTLKYQVEFHTSEELETGQVEIRIPAVLYTDRYGEARLPDDIGVPEASVDADYNVTKTVSSMTTPFNWYLDGRTNELVFFNYRTIKSGSNASFQVLYKDIDIMDVPDETTWSLTPTATVTKTNGTVQESDGTELTGHVDTGVVLSSVTKTPYYATGKSYTPALYTQSQVENYIDGSLPEEFSGDNFSLYKYVVWKITVKGDATQAWSLSTEDVTSLSGVAQDAQIVGYKWLRETGSDYYASRYGWSNGTVVESTQRDIKLKFYVVTAYPEAEIQEGDVLENTITQIITPADGYDAVQRLSASAQFTYVDYTWTYSGNIIGIDKWAGSSGTNKTKTYSSWLDIYENNQPSGTDTGALPFYSISRCYGYGYTHNILGANQTGVGSATGLGDYIPGTYYQVTTVDDVVYAYPNSDSTATVMLNDDDYYFSSVTFTITDRDYDVYEDTMADAVTVDEVDQNAYIYAKFSGSDDWTYVATADWDGTGTLNYSFTEADLAKEPYRVKAVHNATGYSTVCRVDVSVTLRADSPAILAMQKSYGDALLELNIENLSGVSGERFSSGGSLGYFHDTSIENGNYSESGLADFTQTVYGTILMRDNGFSILTRLQKHAQSMKYGNAENDADNSRVLVDYYLTAYEGYIVPDEATKITLMEQGVTLADRDGVVYYDLLPYGMKYNASAGVTAGRIVTIYGNTWKTQPRAWDSSGVSVTVDADSDVIQNWNGSGRTMVVFHIQYDGDDPGVYSEGMWLEGYAVHFQAYYDWADMGSVNSEYNISAYMPETGDDVPLYGTASEVFCDDGTVPTTVNEDYSAFTSGDINGDGVTNIRNILYARNLTVTDVATAAENSIVKLVRADDDPFASFSTKTAVGLSKGYTYEITVTNPSNSTMSGIVVYDVLEDALDRLDIQGETVFEDDTEGSWTGTFTGIVTQSLETAGIAPVVWYNSSRDASISEASQAPSEILNAANGWYRSTEWPYASSEVQAVAVDLSTKADGTAFTLGAGELVSFQINMTSPAAMQNHIYAYNNPSFYSVTTKTDGSVDSATVTGTAVRVELADTGTIEVVKSFGTTTTVPEAFTDQEFEFTLSRDGSVLANQKYVLYDYVEGGWIKSGVVLATDISGTFTLTALQKAVFENVAHYKDVTVQEKEYVFFETEEETTVSDTLSAWLFTNTYLPVVFAAKKVNLLGNDIDESAYTFTFRISVYDGNDYVPLSNSTYYYVSEASEDGVSSEILGSGVTGANGEFMIKAGEIVALYPGEIGTKYRIEETDTTEDFFAVSDTVSGTVTELAQTAVITNIYKYRTLILTKSISGQNASECDTTFTFVLTDSSGNPVSGVRYAVIDSAGNEVTDANGDPEEDATGSDGSFTLTGAGSGRRIKIYGLLYNETYTVTETGYDETLYVPVNEGIATVTMAVYSTGKMAGITNKYRLRDLSVSKLVVSGDLDDAAAATLKNKEFLFYIAKLVNGTYTAVSETAYTVNGVEHVTGADGSFSLKNGETALFEDVGYEGDVFRITEAQDSEFGQVYPADNEPGYVTLSDRGGEVQFINGQEGMVFIEKQVYGLDAVGEAFTDILKEDNTTEVFSGATYSIPVSIAVYDTENLLVTDGNYSCIYISQAGDVTATAFTGMLEMELLPFDQAFLANIPEGYTVRVTETSEWELVHAAVSANVSLAIGSEEIISEAETAQAEATAGEEGAKATLVNRIGTAGGESEIHKAMTDDSSEVETGAVLVLRIEKYNGSGWEAASGIRYILMDDEGAVSGILTTADDGLVSLTKTDSGYPYVRFPDDEIYANVYTGMETGTLRAVELLEQSDESWGILSGYGSSSLIGNAVTIAEADTIVNANDSGSTLTIEKYMETENEEAEFTFQVTHVLSASELPITDPGQILASEPGADLYYVVYDSETDEFVAEGYTDEKGQLTIKAGQYAVITIPDDTVWEVYELQQAGFELVDVSTEGETASVAGSTALVQEEKTISDYNVKYAVSVYGIDTGTGQVTFGPATGNSYLHSYVSKETIEAAGGTHSSEYCIHDLSWEEIAALAKSNPGVFESCLKNGCTKSVNLILNSALLGTDYSGEMDDGDGAGTLKESMNGSYRSWNSGKPNQGGWTASRIRATLNGADNYTDTSVAGSDVLRVSQSLFSCFPKELQTAIVAKAVKSNTVYNSVSHKDIAITYDKLWLFSYKEITDYNSKYNLRFEGTQYSRFTEYATTNASRVAYDESGSAMYWWIRSLSYTYNYITDIINSSGSLTSSSSVLAYGVSPGFVLGNPASEEEESTEDYTVKYAVSVYGIREDLYRTESGGTATAGLTFGPASGASYVKSYVSKETVIDGGGSHDSGYCIHDMSWEEIIAQSQKDPTVFQDCLNNGCTKSICIDLNSSIISTDYYGQMDDGDGTSTLYRSFSTDYNAWNGNSDSYTNEGGWPASKIRATLNGADQYTNTTDTAVAGDEYVLNTGNCLLTCFPEELQSAIVAKLVKSNTVYNSTSENDVVTTYDKLWLLSYMEYYNYPSSYALKYEGAQYSRMTNYAADDSARILYNESGQTWFTWLRSIYTGNNQNAYMIGAGGTYSHINACYAYGGISPGFCLK